MSGANVTNTKMMKISSDLNQMSKKIQISYNDNVNKNDNVENYIKILFMRLLIQKIENHIYDSLVDDGHFPKNPKKVRGLYTVVGVVFSFTSFFL